MPSASRVCVDPRLAGKGRAGLIARSRAAKVSQLRNHLESQGCFIDPRLEYVEAATPGLFAAASVQAGEVLLTIPEYVGMSIRDAERAILPTLRGALPLCLKGEMAPSKDKDEEFPCEALSEHFESIMRQALDPAEMLLALFVVLERRKGAASAWHSYLETLPSELAPAWARPPAEARDALSRTALSEQDKEQFAHDVAAAAVLLRCQCADMADAWSKASGQLIPPDEVMWALAHVHSRAYGTSSSLMLTPYADLINHSSSPTTPGLTVQANTEHADVMTSFLIASDDLQAQTEVTISYHTAATDPYMSLLTFGFIPEEWQSHLRWPKVAQFDDDYS